MHIGVILIKNVGKQLEVVINPIFAPSNTPTGKYWDVPSAQTHRGFPLPKDVSMEALQQKIAWIISAVARRGGLSDFVDRHFGDLKEQIDWSSADKASMSLLRLAMGSSRLGLLMEKLEANYEVRGLKVMVGVLLQLGFIAKRSETVG